MRKIFLVLIFIAVVLQGEALPKDGMAELYADRFDGKGDVVTAKGHVVLSYDHTLFIGDRATYDKKKDLILVEGNVEVFGSRGNKVLADKVIFEVGKNRVVLSDFYQTDRDDIWFYAEEGEKEDGNYTLRNSVLSSCQPDNPDWSIKFDEAVYDSETKYMRLRGVKFYAQKTPVLYTPYLGFSLNRQRSSGFLMPHLGLKKDEGFIYDQPYFWAISPEMDLQFDPQIRTKRGEGFYGTFRFVDGPDSHGEIRTGYFRDKGSFTDKYELKNTSHYGLEFLYESSNALASLLPEGYRDGFYANIDLFNDIDYHNLQYEELSHLEATSRYKESRINYFLYNDENYFGIRGRYFIDTQSIENNETIQELPSLQYHRYYTPLIPGLIDYSVDARFDNYYRKEGAQAQRGLVSAPLLFHTSLFGEYLNLAIEEELAAADTHFNNEALWSSSSQTKENHYAAVTLHHSIELSSDLVRAYAPGIHTMLLKAAFTKTSILAEGNLKYDEIDEGLRRDFDLEKVYNSRLAFSMHHFWESSDKDFDADYLILADYYPDNDSRWNQLRQELHLHYGKLTFSSRIDYSIQYNTLSQIANTLEYSDEKFGLSLTHTRMEREYSQILDENEIGFKARYHQNEELTWYGGYSYDFKAAETKDWQAGITLDRKCWNFTIVFEQETTPILKENGGGSIHNNAIYFRFNLVPFGGVGGASGKTAI